MAESLPSTEVPLIADLTPDVSDERLAGVRVGVVTFPGTLDDRDAARAVRIAGGTPVPLWYKDSDLQSVDAVIIPGGFSYGDYLRAGSIAAKAPMMREVHRAATADGTSGSAPLPVLGICNGFQILTEMHLLPGSMIKNDHLKFVCTDQRLRVENTETPWTAELDRGGEIVVPLKNQDGQYVADARTLRQLEEENRVVFRYVGGNPNGSRQDIAGVTNERGNVVGLMPHPEHAVEPGFGPSSSGTEEVAMRYGSDGLRLFTSLLRQIVAA
ncbi:phosphoribosylformylglycinamidine synthase subunit PurQ [Kocuria koreensis]|jgi:phosphoribosylformylglycinamidine synthase I|uniref:Phosphoribosylformylglycinamidine synthase subunit PurQ n=1 Tax=Rothia koreensis TaxID=592378 RepID=A0A7K1LJZ4_9MICC|nr:phosphoribosylformylglycinamidine synthase subunit PurQ [Rothia koreensis]MUN55445.1 phosphoribosylformylglycinamidine synthase subunit PurQ [Rothia koreensis]